MLHVSSPKTSRKRHVRNYAVKRRVRFPGLVNDAAKLRVHRNHLYLVLSGKRISHSLKRRYQQLKGQ
jgi:hypothetical protein